MPSCFQSPLIRCERPHVPPSFQKEPTEHSPCGKAAHVGPKRHSTNIFRETKRQRADKDLTQNPESQVGDGGNLNKQRQEKKRDGSNAPGRYQNSRKTPPAPDRAA